MRLWHKDLIPYLPHQQLVAQWRECCAICSNWANKGSPNHLLVNKVMEYSKTDLKDYTNLILLELDIRNYNVSAIAKKNFMKNFLKIKTEEYIHDPMFENWHTDRYLKQCLLNLQEKYDCGGIPDAEWKVIQDKFSQYLN